MVDDHKAAAVFASSSARQSAVRLISLPMAVSCTGLQQPISRALSRWLVQGRTNDQPLGRNGTHQVVELAFDGFHALENIGVVVFQVVQDQGVRAVMDKLGALVEERAVVFIGLDDKEIALPRRADTGKSWGTPPTR